MCNGPQLSGAGIAIIGPRTRIDCNWLWRFGPRSLQLAWAEESIAIQSFDWRSNRQTGGQHLLLAVARSLRAELLLKECSKLVIEP